MSAEGQKVKRLHEGGVGPQMRSPAGLGAEDTAIVPTGHDRPQTGIRRKTC